MQNKVEKGRAGVLEIALALFFPIIGVILYLLMRKHETNAKVYLIAAFLGLFLFLGEVLAYVWLEGVLVGR